MATIRKDVPVKIEADRAWAALSDFGKAGELFAGVLVGCRRAGNLRTVTFFNGVEVSERLITIDNDERRVVYAVLDGPFSHHNASMQIIARGYECTFVWIADFLPDDAGERTSQLMEAGCQAIQRNLVG